MKEFYDVIVVGASVAGLRAGKKLADFGLDVLIIDKKQEIGVPVRCGEGLSKRAFDELEIKPKDEFIAGRIRGAKLISPNGKELMFEEEKVNGYILERKMFEKYLAKEAARAGAEIRLMTLGKEVIKNGEQVVGLKIEEFGEEKIIKTRVVVAADGPESRIGKSAGLNTLLVPYHADVGIQYELAGIELEREDIIEFYFGKSVAPRGYVWVFPKGKDVANVGVGIEANHPKPAKYYLDKFLKEKGWEEKSFLEINAGIIPVGGLLERFATNGLVVVGDAAHQVNPIHGGGMHLAMQAADFASEAIKKAFEKNDFTEKTLGEYTRKWWSEVGVEMERLLKIRMAVEKLTDEDLNYIADVFTGEEIIELIHSPKTKVAMLLTKKLVKNPKLLSMLLKYFS